MAGRSLSPDEAALWGRLRASVRPMHERVAALPTAMRLPERRAVAMPVEAPVRPVARVHKAPSNTLDGGWDRKLGRGAVQPDMTIDLHGHTLASAHGALDHGLERAIRGGCRVVLLVTGRPPRPESERPHARGAIRAAIGDWLAASRHSDRIAAVRGAHPRHGGAGALYLILRRARGE